DAAPGERVGAGLFGGTAGGDRAAGRNVEPAGASGDPRARERGRVRRPGAALPSGAGADGRGPGDVPGGGAPRWRSAGPAELAPLQLEAKEGLALNNGTQVHAGIGAL